MRFIGREQELALLERLYQSEKFEFLVLYGIIVYRNIPR